MSQYKATARWTGLFFILATLMGILNAGMVGPVIGTENYLAELGANASLIRWGMVFNCVMAIAVTFIAIAIYPVLRRANETAAVGYVALRTFEGVVLAIGGISWLLLIPLGEAFNLADSTELIDIQVLADALVGASLLTFIVGAKIVFGITALVLNAVLFRARLVPGFISIWGFLGGLAILVLGTLQLLAIPTDSLEIALTAPIALNEMVLAVWLLVKGFNANVNLQAA